MWRSYHQFSRDLDGFGNGLWDAAALGYPTVLAFNGARHVIVPGVRLGAQIDYEPDGQPNSNATGDDLACPVPVGPCLNDDDGVLFLQPWYVGQTIQVGVIASTNGLLSAWVDFNQNGSWLDVGDQIFADQPVSRHESLELVASRSALTGPTLPDSASAPQAGLLMKGKRPMAKWKITV
jgi:hypothetical protein